MGVLLHPSPTISDPGQCKFLRPAPSTPFCEPDATRRQPLRSLRTESECAPTPRRHYSTQIEPAPLPGPLSPTEPASQSDGFARTAPNSIPRHVSIRALA